jgi:hypothetical protein
VNTGKQTTGNFSSPVAEDIGNKPKYVNPISEAGIINKIFLGTK